MSRYLAPQVGSLLLTAFSVPLAAGAQAFAAGRDTAFIERAGEGGYHAVFIAAADDSIWYERVAGDIGDVSRNRFVRQQMRMLEEMGVRPEPAAHTAPLADRVGVKRWNGEYYLYAPCDWGHHRQMQLHPQWLLTNEMDGPVAHAIVQRSPAGDGELMRFRCISMISHALDPKRDTVEVTVRPVEEERGIELWEFRDGAGDVAYELMAPMGRARSFPLIVNHSPQVKRREMDFAAPGPHLLMPLGRR